MNELEQQAAWLDLVSRWADDLAHEIKNPLHAMVINLELVKRRAASGAAEDAVGRAEVVESELHRVHELVDSLLRLVRPWSDATSTPAHDVFTALEPIFRARCRIQGVRYRHEGGNGFAAIRPEDLARLLVALVDSGITAAPEDSDLITRIDADDETVRITVRSRGYDSDPDAGGATPDLTRALLDRAGGSLAFEPLDHDTAEARVALPATGAA